MIVIKYKINAISIMIFILKIYIYQRQNKK